MTSWYRYFALSAVALGLGTSVVSADPGASVPSTNNQNVFVMGGPFSTGYFGETLSFWDSTYESNFLAGVGYQYFFYQYGDAFKLGVEAGGALRIGERSSAEVWAGGVARLDIPVGDFTISPALTAGFSVVTDTIGVETDRAAEVGRAVPVLYYLGPEVSVSHKDVPNLELLARVQHRSGGFGTIAPVDGSNAAVLGLRYKF